MDLTLDKPILGELRKKFLARVSVQLQPGAFCWFGFRSPHLLALEAASLTQRYVLKARPLGPEMIKLTHLYDRYGIIDRRHIAFKGKRVDVFGVTKDVFAAKPAIIEWLNATQNKIAIQQLS